MVAQALRIVREECADKSAFRAFEQYVLLNRSADIVAAELNTTVNNIHQAKSRITKRLREVVERLRRETEEERKLSTALKSENVGQWLLPLALNASTGGAAEP